MLSDPVSSPPVMEYCRYGCGLGVPAFSSVQGTGSARNNGLVVLKGSTAVEVFWGGPLAKIAALMRKILPTV